MVGDSPELRQLLKNLFRNPLIEIDGVANPSGQRIVYFCRFEGQPSPVDSLSWAPKGIQPTTWGRVVVKVSEPSSPESAAYLLKEVEILKSLNSKSFPKLLFHQIFTEDPTTEQPLGSRLLVTIEEHIASVPLRDLTNCYRDESAACKLLSDLIMPLSLLWEHPKRLVHRDLKPENILIKSDGQVAIIDLGIVREEGATGITYTGSPWGPCSSHYASPEQASNDKLNISFKSDFFALGVIVYELVSGKNPFGDKNTPFTEVLHNVINFTPPPLSAVASVSVEFSALIQRLMEKQPYRRFRRVADLQSAIEQLI